MSTLRIPPLTSLRPRQAGRGGRERNPISHKSHDEIVQSTDIDAAMSRLSAVSAGYLTDPFARLLTTAPVQRRLPLMNTGKKHHRHGIFLTLVGTYVRTSGIDRIVHTFIASTTGRKQIISLGAGSDTRFFRLKKDHPDLDLVYHEVDFSANTIIKIERLRAASGAIHSLCGYDLERAKITDGNLESADYNIHAQDLREMSRTFDDLPTLIISECCLVYLSPSEADNVLTRLIKSFQTVAVVIYEPIRPDDAFGRTMVRNLTSRGIHLNTMEKYANLEGQRKRLRDNDLNSKAVDMEFVYRRWTDNSERERLNELERMDEMEEFVLLAEHYCIAFGWAGFADDSKWADLEER